MNNKKLLILVITIVLVMIFISMLGGGEPEGTDAGIQSPQSSPAGSSLKSLPESSEVVTAIDNFSFDDLSSQQKNKLQLDFDRATEHLLKRDWDQAETLLNSLVEKFPSVVESYINLGFIYANTGRLSEAREILVKGIGANQNYDFLFKNLQSIHGAMAAKAYRSALISDDSSDSLSDLADVELNLSLVSSLDLSKVDQDLQKTLVNRVKGLQSEQANKELAQRDFLKRIEWLEVELLESNNKVAQMDAEFESKQTLFEVTLDRQSLALVEQVAMQEQTIAEQKKILEQAILSNNAVVVTDPIVSDPGVIVVDIPAVVPAEIDEPDVVEMRDQITEVEKAAGIVLVKDWAARWSAQDVQGYIQRYANNYRPTNNDITHIEWRDQRQIRLTNKQFIEVDVDDFEFEETDTQFSVIFSQRYRANTMDDTITKKLVFSKNGKLWDNAKIIDEIIVKS